MKILEINYNQVSSIHDFESIEAAYATHFARNIELVECPQDLDVRRGWGCVDGEFIQPEGEGHVYVPLDNGIDFMLVPDGVDSQAWIDDVQRGILESNTTLRDYAREEYLLELMSEGTL